MDYGVNVKIEIEDGSYINDSANSPYRMKLFAADKGPEELSQCDKKQGMKNKAICKYCIHYESCLEEENKI